PEVLRLRYQHLLGLLVEFRSARDGRQNQTRNASGRGDWNHGGLHRPPSDAVPDISATSESNLIDAWNGTGAYTKDHKQRHNYRVVAVIRTSTYILAAASKKSGITDLRQIKDRKDPTWIAGGNGNDLIF